MALNSNFILELYTRLKGFEVWTHDLTLHLTLAKEVEDVPF